MLGKMKHSTFGALPLNFSTVLENHFSDAPSPL